MVAQPTGPAALIAVTIPFLELPLAAVLAALLVTSSPISSAASPHAFDALDGIFPFSISLANHSLNLATILDTSPALVAASAVLSIASSATLPLDLFPRFLIVSPISLNELLPFLRISSAEPFNDETLSLTPLEKLVNLSRPVLIAFLNLAPLAALSTYSPTTSSATLNILPSAPLTKS